MIQEHSLNLHKIAKKVKPSKGSSATLYRNLNDAFLGLTKLSDLDIDNICKEIESECEKTVAFLKSLKGKAPKPAKKE